MKKLFSKVKTWVVICLLVAAGHMISCSGRKGKTPAYNEKPQIYTTWEDICYDRAASIWLIHKYVDSAARFRFVPFGDRITAGIPFDVPGAGLGRQRNMSCFETVIQKYGIGDPAISRMGEIVHDIDVNIWGVKRFGISDSLDRDFKALRSRIDDEYILLDSMSGRFDALYRSLENGGSYAE